MSIFSQRRLNSSNVRKKIVFTKNAEGKVQLTLAEQINGFYMITASVMKGLMSNHSYYYQVQTQLLVTGFKFCDFFVRAEKDTFCNVLLPEHIGRYFTD